MQVARDWLGASHLGALDPTLGNSWKTAVPKKKLQMIQDRA